MRTFLLLTFLSLLTISWTRLEAQESIIPQDSTDFGDFLVLQDQVPGLSFRWQIKDKSLPESLLLDSLFLLAKTDSGYISQPMEHFAQLQEMSSRFGLDSLNVGLSYRVYSEEVSWQGAREYLANLVRNGDYQPIYEVKDVSEDLVVLAKKIPYSPFLKFKILFISDYKLFIVTAVIIFFFVVSIVMIIFMIILKVKKSKREQHKKEYENLIIDPLTSLLFEKELDEISVMKASDFHAYFPAELLQKVLFKEVLIQKIIGLNKKMKGEFKGKLKTIYQKLDLDKMSIQSLKSGKWYKITQGLVEINEMDLVEALTEVKGHANSDNFHVRSQAVATLLNLSEKVDLNFLKDQTFPLSEWQQMNYLRIIKFVSNVKPLKLEVLFESSNQSIRVFGIKLVRMLGRLDLLVNLANISEEVGLEEQIEILETYETLGAHMEVGFINRCLSSEYEELAFAAAKAAFLLGDENSVKLIYSRLAKDQLSFKLKKQLLKTLHALDISKFDQATIGASDPISGQIRAHILDPLLSHV